MSEENNKGIRNLSENLLNKLDKGGDNFVQLIDLERALKSQKTIQSICEERFIAFRDRSVNQLIPKDIILESFKRHELHLSVTLSERYKSSSNQQLLLITRRANFYFREISNFAGTSEDVTNTFDWFGKDEKQKKRRITFLFKLITGANSAKLNLLHPDVTLEAFLNCFSGKTLTSKICWRYDLGALIYLIGKLSDVALVVPKIIDTDQTLKTSKKLWIYLNEKMIACFLDQDGNHLNRTQLNSLRSKFKKKSSEAKALVDEIVSELENFQVRRS